MPKISSRSSPAGVVVLVVVDVDVVEDVVEVVCEVDEVVVCEVVVDELVEDWVAVDCVVVWLEVAEDVLDVVELGKLEDEVVVWVVDVVVELVELVVELGSLSPPQPVISIAAISMRETSRIRFFLIIVPPRYSQRFTHDIIRLAVRCQ